jgi:hypothetical protein
MKFNQEYHHRIINNHHIFIFRARLFVSKLIKLTAKTLHDTKARIEVNQSYIEYFEVTTGVKQGDPLSKTLFSIVIDDIIKQLELSGNISTGLEQCSAYADDTLLTARTKQTLMDTFKKLKKHFIAIWLYSK